MYSQELSIEFTPTMAVWSKKYIRNMETPLKAPAFCYNHPHLPKPLGAVLI